MKRILFSLVTLALVSLGFFQFVVTQRCEAIPIEAVASQMIDAPIVETGTVDAVWHPAQGTTDELAQSGPPTPFIPTSNTSTKRTIKVPRTTTVYEDQVVEVQHVTPLQQQYSILMLKRAQRMTEDELKAAIEKVESELSEQDEAAHTELQKAIEILKQLKENSDGTPAASRAAGALPILENSTPPTASGSAPFFDADASTLNEPAPALTPLPTY